MNKKSLILLILIFFNYVNLQESEQEVKETEQKVEENKKEILCNTNLLENETDYDVDDCKVDNEEENIKFGENEKCCYLKFFFHGKTYHSCIYMNDYRSNFKPYKKKYKEIGCKHVDIDCQGKNLKKLNIIILFTFFLFLC